MSDIIEKVRSFIDNEVLPIEGAFLQHGFLAVAPDLERVRDVARRDGLFAPHLPVDMGGLGLPLTVVGEVSRVLGRTPLGHFSLHM